MNIVRMLVAVRCAKIAGVIRSSDNVYGVAIHVMSLTQKGLVAFCAAGKYCTHSSKEVT